MLCCSLLFIIIGVLNIRADNFKTVSIVIFAAFITSYWTGKLIYGKGKEQLYIQSGKNYDLTRKKVYGFFGVIIFVFSFIIMILSAILMSYLFSIDLLG